MEGRKARPRVCARPQSTPLLTVNRALAPCAAKDLSHVPCKFFKVGSCTAGSSCPFSHAVLEPGQAKEVCTWFVKGNCKFGHKCALAHILPGQSMSMDRKNKKAAQLAAQAGGAGGGGRDGGRRGHKSGAHGSGSGSAQSRNALLTGSTAPTRALSGNARSGIPMPLKATLSPSTPAPPVKDTDFASFGLPDESNKLPSAPAQGKPPAAPAPDTSSTVPLSNPTDTGPVQIESSAGPEVKEPGPLPTSTPTAPRRVGNPHGSPPVDFGPIGSPPRSLESGGRPARVNGFSPGTSPNHAGLSSSPFSAPGSRTVFAIQDEDSSGGLAGRSGLSASLGAMMPWSNDHPSRRLESGVVGEVVVEDEDLEEFLPGSLTDLLTPEERSRRMSRTNGARPNMLGAEREGALGAQRPSLDDQHHRYSRSVPAPSLLQDIKSIWSDNNGAITGGSDLAGTPGTSVTGGGLGNGTPSSFTSNSGLAGRSGEEMLSPSNASAAFLPGLHHHYLNSKVQRTNLLGGGLSAQHTSNANGLTHSGLVGSHSAGVGAAALSPPRTSALGNQFPVGSPSSDVFYGQQRNAAPSNDGYVTVRHFVRSCIYPALGLGKRTPPGSHSLRVLLQDTQESMPCRRLSSHRRLLQVHSVRQAGIRLVPRRLGMHRARLATGTAHHLVPPMHLIRSCNSLHRRREQWATHWAVSKVSSRDCRILLQRLVRIYILTCCQHSSSVVLQGVAVVYWGLLPTALATQVGGVSILRVHSARCVGRC